MKLNYTKAIASLCLSAGIASSYAGVCNIVPGSVTCGKGTVKSLSGNGSITIHGTTIQGNT